MAGLVIILIFIILLFFNVPVAISLGVASVGYLLFLSPLPIDLAIQSFVSGVDSFTLLAVPFFILSGDIMMRGGISERLINFCSAILGKIIGSLAMVTVFASMIFAAISGSGPATVACVGGITIPAMEKEKYESSFAGAIASCAGALGPIIPPSLSFIMYGVIASQSITDMFLAGIIPGIMMGIVLMIYCHYTAKKHHMGRGANPEVPISTEKVSIWKSFKEAFLALMVPVIILGGIYGGIFTPTEAAIVACDYALIISIFVYKKISIKDIPAIFKSTVLTSGTVMILVACATSFGRLLTMAQVPNSIAAAILSVSSNRIVVLLLINVFLFFVGMLMETLAAIIILSPILLPIVT